jgi:oligopeptide transport system substrate-binding protein
VPPDREAQFSSPVNDFVCSGPFKLVQWEPKVKILLKKNPFARNSFPVSLDKIQISIIPDVKQAFSLFEKGVLDWVGEPFSPLPLNHLPALLENWRTQPVGGVTLCFFNTQQPPFSNPMLRQAFSYAIHREKILRKLSIPHASVARGLVPPILKGNRITKFFPDADVKLAQELFQKGLKTFKKNAKRLRLTLTFEASEIWFQIAKSLQYDWEEAFSIRIDLEPLDFKIFYERLSKRQYTFALERWMAQYTSPMNILERFKDQESGKNFSGWENREYGHLLKSYAKQVNEEKRIDLVEQAEHLLMEHMPAAPIYYFSYSYLKKPYVKNLLFSPIGRVYLEQVFFNMKQQESMDHLDNQPEIELNHAK